MLIRSPRMRRIWSVDRVSRSWPSNNTWPASIATGLGHEPHDRQARHALAAARLADQAHDLAAVDVEVDAVDRAHDAVSRMERRAQALDLEQRPFATLVLGAPLRRRDDLLDDIARDGRDRAACRSWPPARRPRVRPRSSVQSRVERVAQAVAEQVETEDREGDRDTRCQDDVRRVEQLVPLAARSSSPIPGWSGLP